MDTTGARGCCDYEPDGGPGGVGCFDRALPFASTNGCAVYITETFRVVPQQPRVLNRRVCARVHKTDAGIVADRCTPAGAVSLTKIST